MGQFRLSIGLTAVICIMCLSVILMSVKIANADESRSLQPSSTRGILQTMFENGRKLLIKKQKQASHNNTSLESRTFGRIKKLQSMLIPFMFKFGIMWMMILITMFLALKGVAIGSLILVINIIGIVAKLIAWKYELKSDHHHHPQPYYGWAPPQKDIHLHIHGAAASVHRDEPYGSYSDSRPTYSDPSYLSQDWQPQKFSPASHRVISL